MRSLRPLLSLLAVLLAATCSTARPAGSAEPPVVSREAPRRIILLIGDGMGPAHVAAMRLVGEPFHLARFPVQGTVTTHSANAAVTDSAAAATALATGIKTNNRMVSVDPLGNRLPTVLEKAASQGLATGVVTTTNFYDATPAAFAAHARSRADGTTIIQQMLEGPLDLVIGAGAQIFGVDRVPTVEQAAAMWKRKVVSSSDASLVSPGQRLLRIFPRQPNDVDFPEARLATLARFALDVVEDDPEGFFLLIEHEGIDSASHNHATDAMLESLRSFNETIGVARDFAEKHPGTIVIVTGDHETGGLRISGSSRETLRVRWTTTDHTPVAIPLFAYGPGAPSFAGLRDNTSIGRLLFALLR